jgi:hypothetical protein
MHRSRVVVVALIGAIDAVFVASYIAMDPGDAAGLEEMGVHFAGLGMLFVAAWTGVLASFVWKGRTWAQVASLLTFGPMAVVSLLLSIDVVRRMQEISSQAPPRVHLIAPALVTIFAGSITALVSSSVRRERA